MHFRPPVLAPSRSPVLRQAHRLALRLVPHLGVCLLRCRGTPRSFFLLVLLTFTSPA